MPLFFPLDPTKPNRKSDFFFFAFPGDGSTDPQRTIVPRRVGGTAMLFAFCGACAALNLFQAAPRLPLFADRAPCRGAVRFLCSFCFKRLLLYNILKRITYPRRNHTFYLCNFQTVLTQFSNPKSMISLSVDIKKFRPRGELPETENFLTTISAAPPRFFLVYSVCQTLPRTTPAGAVIVFHNNRMPCRPGEIRYLRSARNASAA